MWQHNIHVILFPLYTWSNSWNSFPLFIKICFFISIIALIGIVLAISNIFIKRILSKREEEKAGLIAKKVNEMMLAMVVSDASGEGVILTSRQFNASSLFTFGLSSTKVKRILVTEMLKYRNYFSGSIAERIRRIYISLLLHKEALQRVHSKNWEVSANALSELFKMDIEVDQAYLIELVHNSNRYIREFARLLLIKFTKEDPLQLLRDIDEPLSQWQDFEIFLLFQQRTNYTLGSLEGLLSLTKESSVVALCLQLAVFFEHKESIPLLVDLLSTPDLKLRAQTINALGKLEAETAAPHLVNIYPGESHEIQLKILTALGNIRSSSYLSFLEKEFLSSEDFEIKKFASDAIIKLYPLSSRIIDKLMENRGVLNQKILNHSLDPLINAE